jgi:hypothetical protein
MFRLRMRNNSVILLNYLRVGLFGGRVGLEFKRNVWKAH